MNDILGKIEFSKQDTQIPISTSQIPWMFDPNGAALIEFTDDGYILTTFEKNSQDTYCPRRRFFPVADRELIWSAIDYVV